VMRIFIVFLLARSVKAYLRSEEQGCQLAKNELA